MSSQGKALNLPVGRKTDGSVRALVSLYCKMLDREGRSLAGFILQCLHTDAEWVIKKTEEVARAFNVELESPAEKDWISISEKSRVLHSVYGVDHAFVCLREVKKHADSEEFVLEDCLSHLARRFGLSLCLAADGKDLEFREQDILREVNGTSGFTCDGAFAKRVQSMRNFASFSPNKKELMWTDFDVEFVEREGSTEGDEDGNVHVILPESYREKYRLGEVNITAQPRALFENGFIKGYGYVTFDRKLQKPLVNTTREDLKSQLAHSEKRVLFLLCNINGSVEAQQKDYHGATSTGQSYAELNQYLGIPATDADKEFAVEMYLNHQEAYEATLASKVTKIQKDFGTGDIYRWADEVQSDGEDFSDFFLDLFGDTELKMAGTRPDRTGAARCLLDAGINPSTVTSLGSMVRAVSTHLMNQKTNGLEINGGTIRVNPSNRFAGQKALKFCGAEVRGTNLKYMPMAAYMTQKMCDSILAALPRAIRNNLESLKWDSEAGEVIIKRTDGRETVWEFIDTRFVPGWANGNCFICRKHCTSGSKFRVVGGGCDFDGDQGSFRSHDRGKTLSVVRHPIGPGEMFRILKHNSLIFINQKNNLLEMLNPFDSQGNPRMKKVITEKMDLKANPFTNLDDYIDQRYKAYWAMYDLGLHMGTVIGCVYSQMWYSKVPAVIHNESFIDAFLGMTLDEHQLGRLAEWVNDHKAKSGCTVGKELYSIDGNNTWTMFTNIVVKSIESSIKARKELCESLFSKRAAIEHRMAFLDKNSKVAELVNRVATELGRKFTKLDEPKHWLAAMKVAHELADSLPVSPDGKAMMTVLVLSLRAKQLNLSEEELGKYWDVVFTDSNPCFKLFKGEPWARMNADHPAIVGLIELASL